MEIPPHHPRVGAWRVLYVSAKRCRILCVVRRARASRVLFTDNGSAFRSKLFLQACDELELKHRCTSAYRPQANGKAERLIQSALPQWAYGIAYNHSAPENARTVDSHYHWHRPRHGIKRMAPISCLAGAETICCGSQLAYVD
jgi:transposase InsO family protein